MHIALDGHKLEGARTTSVNGHAEVISAPRADLQSPPTHWLAHNPTLTADAAGGPGPVKVTVCAMNINASAPLVALQKPGTTGADNIMKVGFGSAFSQKRLTLDPSIPAPTGVTAADPCGNSGFELKLPGFGDILVTRKGKGAESAGDEVGWSEKDLGNGVGTIDVGTVLADGHYALWSTAVRDDLIEEYRGVELVIGVDTLAPTITAASVTQKNQPGDNSPAPVKRTGQPVEITTGLAAVTFKASDGAGASGVGVTECRVVPPNPDPNSPPGFRPCVSGDVLEVGNAAGVGSIEIHAIDRAGHETTVSKPILIVTGSPPVHITRAPNDNVFHHDAPTVTLSAEALRVNENLPFLFRIDGGLPKPCNPAEQRRVHGGRRRVAGGRTSRVRDPCVGPREADAGRAPPRSQRGQPRRLRRLRPADPRRAQRRRPSRR